MLAELWAKIALKIPIILYIYNGHMFLFIFWPIGLNFLWEVRRPLSINFNYEKSWFWCLFQKTYFWHENGCGRPTLLAPKGLGLQNPTKKLAHWSDPLGQPLSRNHGFKIFRPESLNLRSIFTFLLFLIELKRSYRELFSGWKNVVTSQSY